MYNQLTVMDNMIVFARWQLNVIKTKDGIEVCKTTNGIYDEETCQMIKKNLDKYGVTYTIVASNVPENMKKYNFLEWYGSENEAILYVNGDGYAKINHLKQMLLKTDYKSIRDTSRFARGLMTPEEKGKYLDLENWRQQCRDEINALENGQ